MSATSFIYTNILLYLLSPSAAKANRAEEVLRGGGRISVQVLNEMASVMRRKLSMPWHEVNDVLFLIRSICPVEPLTLEVHDRGRRVAERWGLSLYDGMIAAAALLSNCDILYSEDMQHDLLIDEQLRIQNPFFVNCNGEN
ncbi:Predicted nucleic acid-binding protein, contains PIN domain [Nitrosospira multiformis ATCC 25196]|uniref:PilT protein-like protein n=1 Tax=Nitrosospira multiformis (strain ATCC 25196 / NCIMB 11849 / C 71) TaxID=323848 RepID=Q2YAD4_NITMU|nr:PIN domain-containing protein [Nitrosospira multiformis]ABB74287.1 PilT protein-like protein [Nitrosospira multiformis ATCC 25196]SEF49532.1 Predicted nucleic acid-binding protein, contains PIN domain [Nitrosospira multiformis ATCC 25196]